MARLDDWENIIASEINGAPLPTMMDAVRAAAIEFCQRTRIDTRIVESIDYEAAYPDVPVPDVDDFTTPAAVITVWSSYGKILPATKPQLEALFPKGWASLTVNSSAGVQRWYSPRPGVVRLVPKIAANLAAELTMDVAWQPTRNAIQVADFLYELYAEPIGMGAVARLHAHAAAPYADANRVGAYRAMFEAAIVAASDKGATGHQQARHRVATDDLV